MQFNKGNNCPLVYPLLYMIEAAQEKLPIFVTPALGRKALSDVCSLNLLYHYKTVRRVQILLCWPEKKIMAEKEWTTETVLQVDSFF